MMCHYIFYSFVTLSVNWNPLTGIFQLDTVYRGYLLHRPCTVFKLCDIKEKVKSPVFEVKRITVKEVDFLFLLFKVLTVVPLLLKVLKRTKV